MDIKVLRGPSGTYNVRDNEQRNVKLNLKNNGIAGGGIGAGKTHKFQCLVKFLDDTQHVFDVDKKAKGQVLLDQVFEHLDLHFETDFFGLKLLTTQPLPQPSVESHGHSQKPPSLSSSFLKQIIDTAIKSGDTTNTNNVCCDQHVQNNSSLLNEACSNRWLDATKTIRKQFKQLINDQQPCIKFQFRVRFYVSDPSRLQNLETRYHFFLQLKQDILEGRLIVPVSTAITLASYILQSEIGDFHPDEHKKHTYVGQYKLMLNQNDDANRKIAELHRQHKGQTPADAEFNFLSHAKRLERYGIEFYDAKDSDKLEVKIGVSCVGIVVYKDDEHLNTFSWAKIIKIMFKRKNFFVQLRREGSETCDQLIGFNLLSNQACKSFWMDCAAHHSFFRLPRPQKNMNSNSHGVQRGFLSLFNLGSRFRYSGKTEYQTITSSVAALDAGVGANNLISSSSRSALLARTPSTHYARRTIPHVACASLNETGASMTNDSLTTTINGASVASHNSVKNGLFTRARATTMGFDNENGNSIYKTSYSGSFNFVKSLPFIDDRRLLTRFSDNKNHNNKKFEIGAGAEYSSACAATSILAGASTIASSSSAYVDNELERTSGRMSQNETFSSKFGNLLGQRYHTISTVTVATKNNISNSNRKNCPTFNNISSFRSTANTNTDSVDFLNNSSNKPDQQMNERKLNQAKRPKTCDNIDGRNFHKIANNNNLFKDQVIDDVNENGISVDSDSSQDQNTNHEKSSFSNEDDDEKNHDSSSTSSSTYQNVVKSTANKVDKNKSKGDKRVIKTIRMLVGKGGRYGFNVQSTIDNDKVFISKVAADSPAQNCDPKLQEGDQVITINGEEVSGKTHQEIVDFIKSIRDRDPPELILQVYSVQKHEYSTNCSDFSQQKHDMKNRKNSSSDQKRFVKSTIPRPKSLDHNRDNIEQDLSITSTSTVESTTTPISAASTSKAQPTGKATGLREKSKQHKDKKLSKKSARDLDLDLKKLDREIDNHNSQVEQLDLDLEGSILALKKSIKSEEIIRDFESLARRKEDEPLEDSRLMENINKNRYRDILPYDKTRVVLGDAMTGDYINASYVDMHIPGSTRKHCNRYIATQGPLSSTCDDFWQMIWEQSSSLIIMVTPLIEDDRIKCHKYWPDEGREVRYGQLMIKTQSEKTRSATIDRRIMVTDIKSGKKHIVTQVQYLAWPDHEIPGDCSDFLKLVNRVRKHRNGKPDEPVVVHCSAGIGRTGVLILMETALCLMEVGQPIYPLRIVEEMRAQRAMLIQTSNQFKFVAEAIIRVYERKLYKQSTKRSLKRAL